MGTSTEEGKKIELKLTGGISCRVWPGLNEPGSRKVGYYKETAKS